MAGEERKCGRKIRADGNQIVVLKMDSRSSSGGPDRAGPERANNAKNVISHSRHEPEEGYLNTQNDTIRMMIYHRIRRPSRPLPIPAAFRLFNSVNFVFRNQVTVKRY